MQTSSKINQHKFIPVVHISCGWVSYHLLHLNAKWLTACTNSESEFDSWHFKDIFFPSELPVQLWNLPNLLFSVYWNVPRYTAPGFWDWTLIFIYFCVWNKWNCTSTTHLSSWRRVVFYTKIYGALSVWVEGLELPMCEGKSCYLRIFYDWLVGVEWSSISLLVILVYLYPDTADKHT
jgi:hypothetical protein